MNSTSTRGRRGRLALACVGALMLGACAAQRMPEPSASLANIEKLRAAPMHPAMVGTFALAPGKPGDLDTKLNGLRAGSLVPAHGSFALQLRDTVVAELKGAGLYDAASAVLIEGQLTDSQVDAAIGTSSGRLAARFTVKRDGKLVFDKELVAEERWDGAFIGGIAIPEAMRHYQGLYPKLVGQLIDDPDFRAAVAR